MVGAMPSARAEAPLEPAVKVVNAMCVHADWATGSESVSTPSWSSNGIQPSSVSPSALSNARDVVGRFEAEVRPELLDDSQRAVLQVCVHVAISEIVELLPKIKVA